MAFTLQTDEGDVEGANAYIDVAFFTTYHTDRGVDAVINGEYSDTQIQAAIIRATDHIDSKRFGGCKEDEDQATEFPRDLWDGIPVKIQQATAEYALRALSSEGVVSIAPDPEVDARGLQVASKTEKVGPLEESTTYVQGKSNVLPSYPTADRLLSSFVISSRRVYR
jgi:hypothetical protein